jgi:hypothetical protein
VQTLGITDKQQEPDNFFRRIFWPSNHPSNIDLLGQQGFWVCMFVAAISIIQAIVEQHWTFGIVFALVFVLGGMGVREHSRAAAVCISMLYLVNVAGTVVLGQSVPGVLTLAVLGLLLANIRGTWIAARWKDAVAEDDLPTRFKETGGIGSWTFCQLGCGGAAATSSSDSMRLRSCLQLLGSSRSPIRRSIHRIPTFTTTWSRQQARKAQ